MTLAVTVTETATAQASGRRAGLDRLYGHAYPGDMDRYADRLDSAAYATSSNARLDDDRFRYVSYHFEDEPSIEIEEPELRQLPVNLM